MNYNNLIIAPMTSTDKDYPTRVKLTKNSFVVLDQIRTISEKQVVKKFDITKVWDNINKHLKSLNS